MPDLVTSVRHAIEQHNMLASGDTVVVGVSGGPDSLCLLHILQQLTHTLSLDLHIAHLNHCIRGEDADADAAFVAHMAAEWQLPVSVESVDVPALARAQKMALEEAARCARYAFLARVAHAIGACTIALGHNADDQTETVLVEQSAPDGETPMAARGAANSASPDDSWRTQPAEPAAPGASTAPQRLAAAETLKDDVE